MKLLETTSPRDTSRQAPFWQKPSFLLFWGGQSLSNLGDAFALVAIPLLVLQATGSVTQLGLVTAISGVGRLLAGVVSGIIVDRVDRRKFMMLCDASRLFLYGTIPCSWLIAGPQLWLIFVVTALGAIIGMGFQVAYMTAVANLVEVKQITAANSLLQGTFALTYVLGPLLAGLVVTMFGSTPALGVDALSFGVSALSLLGVRFRFSPSTTSSYPQNWESVPTASTEQPQEDSSSLRRYRLLPLELEKFPTGPLVLQEIRQACAAGKHRLASSSLRKHRLLPLELEKFPSQHGLDSLPVQVGVFRRTFTEMVAGFRYLWQHPRLRAVTCLRVGAGLFLLSGGASGIIDLFIFHLVHDLHQRQTAVGWVLGVASIGGIAGALLAPALRQRGGIGPCWLAAIALAGLATIGGGLAPTTAIVAPSTILFTFGGTLESIYTISLRQELTPDVLLGRVSAAFTTLSTLASAVGAIFITHLATYLGASWSLCLAGTWVIGLVALGCFTSANQPAPEHSHFLNQPTHDRKR